MIDLIVIIVVLIVTYISGTILEKNHFKRIREREQKLLKQPYVVDSFTPLNSDIKETKFVDGSCVVAADRFKVFLGGLLSIFGGRIAIYENLTDRARREAIIRMREKARDADMVVCTRIQYTELGARGGQIEAMAYGTAVYLTNKV
jgi:uncharacterized protein YbjQ (UPF0145 family)